MEEGFFVAKVKIVLEVVVDYRQYFVIALITLIRTNIRKYAFDHCYLFYCLVQLFCTGFIQLRGTFRWRIWIYLQGFALQKPQISKIKDFFMILAFHYQLLFVFFANFSLTENISGNKLGNFLKFCRLMIASIVLLLAIYFIELKLRPDK